MERAQLFCVVRSATGSFDVLAVWRAHAAAAQLRAATTARARACGRGVAADGFYDVPGGFDDDDDDGASCLLFQLGCIIQVLDVGLSCVWFGLYYTGTRELCLVWFLHIEVGSARARGG